MRDGVEVGGEGGIMVGHFDDYAVGSEEEVEWVVDVDVQGDHIAHVVPSYMPTSLKRWHNAVVSIQLHSLECAALTKTPTK